MSIKDPQPLNLYYGFLRDPIPWLDPYGSNIEGDCARTRIYQRDEESLKKRFQKTKEKIIDINHSWASKKSRQ